MSIALRMSTISAANIFSSVSCVENIFVMNETLLTESLKAPLPVICLESRMLASRSLRFVIKRAHKNPLVF